MLPSQKPNFESDPSFVSPIAKRIKIVTLVGLVVANMIGAGVFTTSGFALSDLGSPRLVMLAWLVGGLIALSGALSYGALARHTAGSGGEYLFLARIIHPFAGFLAGWVSLLAGFTGAIAFAALAFETYIGPILPWKLPSGALAVILVLVAAVSHAIRLELGVGFQNLVVALKLILILLFIGIAGAVALQMGSATPIDPVGGVSVSAFAGTLVWISLSYSGYNAAVYVAGEADPKLVVRSLWVGTLVVTLIYLSLNFIFLFLVPGSITVGKEDIAGIAAEFLGGHYLALLVRLIIGISLLTSVFAMIMIGPRVYAKMAEDKLFPSFFRFQGDVPRASICLQSAAAVILITFTSLKELLSYLGFTLSLCAAATVSCLLILKWKSKGDSIGAPFLFFPILFVAATIILAALSAWDNPLQILSFFLTLASGGVVYYFLQWRRR